jgi:hypothetical protein
MCPFAMRARTHAAACLAVALVAAPSPRPACAGAWLPERGESVSQVAGSVFSSNSWYDADGNRVASNLKWQERALLGGREVGWKHHTSIRYQLPLLSATIRSNFGSYTSTGFSDASLGLRWGVLRGETPVTLSLDWTAPPGYNRTLSLLGEGLQQLVGSVDAGREIGRRSYVQGSLGWGQRFLSISRKNKNPAGTPEQETARRWSDVVQVSADGGYWLRPELMVGARYQGLSTTTRGNGEPLRHVHVAGPFALLRVTSAIDLQAGSWSVFSGRYLVAEDGSAPIPRALHYDQFYLAAIFRQLRTTRLQGQLGISRQP